MPFKFYDPKSAWPTRQFLAGLVAGISIAMGSCALLEAQGRFTVKATVPVIVTALFVASVATGLARYDQSRSGLGTPGGDTASRIS